MATLRTIRRKIESVRSTQTITRTMWMIAAAKLRRVQDQALNNRAYAHRMAEIMGEIIARTPPESHPLLMPRKVETVLILLITSDRGLCGAFNLNLFNAVEKFLKEHGSPSHTIPLYTIGKKGRDYFKRRGKEVLKERTDLRTLSPSLPREIGEDLIEYYSTMRCDKIIMVYTRFRSVMKQEVCLEDLFPPPPPVSPSPKVDYLFEPARPQLLDHFIGAYLEAQVHKGLLESQASEQAARMNSMDNATNNCREMIDTLTLLYNKSRQTSITKDMIDIVGGAEALKV